MGMMIIHVQMEVPKGEGGIMKFKISYIDNTKGQSLYRGAMSAEKDKFSYLGAVTILLPTDHDVVSHFESEKSELRARVPSI